MTGSAVAGFDADLLAGVAGAEGVEPSRLETLVADLQAAAESVRDVDELVFEYRKAFGGSVVVRRTDEAYFLRVPPHVWPEFATRLDATDAELRALKAAHGRRFAAAVGHPRGDRPGGRGRVDDDEPLVLERA